MALILTEADVHRADEAHGTTPPTPHQLRLRRLGTTLGNRADHMSLAGTELDLEIQIDALDDATMLESANPKGVKLEDNGVCDCAISSTPRSPLSSIFSRQETTITNLMSWDDDDGEFCRAVKERDLEEALRSQAACTSKSRNVVTSKPSKRITTEHVAFATIIDWTHVRKGLTKRKCSSSFPKEDSKAVADTSSQKKLW